MNIFVLCTGRCGSTTFVRVFEFADNFTAAHESRSHCIGRDRLDYPDQLDICRDYCETVTANIKHFVADKPHYLVGNLENAMADFPGFRDPPGLQGDQAAAVAEWKRTHNASTASTEP